MIRKYIPAAALCLWASMNHEAAAQTISRADVSGGYQMVALQDGIDETFGLGWYGELAAHVMPQLSLVFQVGGNYKSLTDTLAFDGIHVTATADLSIHQFAGGVRWRVPRRNRVTPFVHGLAGAARMAADVTAEGTSQGTGLSMSTVVDETHMVFEAGGGVDIGVNGRLGVRAGADYVRLFDDDSGVNAFRFAAGAVWSF